jgi:hypothetical protein
VVPNGQKKKWQSRGIRGYILPPLHKFTMPASCIVVKFTCETLAALCMALMDHVERLNSLLKSSWPDVEEVHEEMYALVDTLLIHGLDQKWFSAFALIKGAEEMVTTQEIHAVSWGSLFCVSVVHF